MTPGFKLDETMSMIAGFSRNDGTYPFGKVTKYVHLGQCHKTFQNDKERYRGKEL
jgi:hypothetical protein